MNITQNVNLNSSQFRQVFVYSAIGFLVPFMLGEPQLLVGSVVNAIIILAATSELSLAEALPIIVLPSVAVMARGLVFGPFTPFLLPMIPFIWAGNAVLFVGVKMLKKWWAFVPAALAKSTLLFSAAYALFSLSVVPAVFLTAMGAFQLVTALIGGALALAASKSGLLRRVRLV